jgi:hypothetical protein
VAQFFNRFFSSTAGTAFEAPPDWSRRINGVRNLRQALASPHPVDLGRWRSARDLFNPRFSRTNMDGGAILDKGMGMKTRILLSLVLTASVVGCAARSARIAEIKQNPGRYDDRSVSVTGIVTSAWSVPLIPYKFYKVDDGSGEITVLAGDGRTPTRGARVKVKGRLEDVATLGGNSIGLHIRQTDLDFRSY